jgi:hypothetical protein
MTKSVSPAKLAGWVGCAPDLNTVIHEGTRVDLGAFDSGTGEWRYRDRPNVEKWALPGYSPNTSVFVSQLH